MPVPRAVATLAIPTIISQVVTMIYNLADGNIVIPGSKNPDHIRNNFDLFDFALTEEEMAEISTLDQNKRYYTTGIQGRRTVKATILWRQRSWT